MNSNSCSQKIWRTRNIKIELDGDLFRKKGFPKIRLRGRWLEALGFKPNGYVTIQPVSPGEMILKFNDAPTPISQLPTTNP